MAEYALYKKALDITDGLSSALVHMVLKENYVIVSGKKSHIRY